MRVRLHFHHPRVRRLQAHLYVFALRSRMTILKIYFSHSYRSRAHKEFRPKFHLNNHNQKMIECALSFPSSLDARAHMMFRLE